MSLHTHRNIHLLPALFLAFTSPALSLAMPIAGLAHAFHTVGSAPAHMKQSELASGIELAMTPLPIVGTVGFAFVVVFAGVVAAVNLTRGGRRRG